MNSKRADALQPGDRLIKQNGRSYRVMRVGTAPVPRRAMAERSVIVWFHGNASITCSRYAISQVLPVC